MKLELEITLSLRLSKGHFSLDFRCYFLITGNSGNFKELFKVAFHLKVIVAYFLSIYYYAIS